MKENDRDFEMLLKSKMDELSESVDCFDRISSRVFKEEDQDFSESGFTVSDLETIPPKRGRSHILRWTAAAAAAAVVIAVIPKTGLPQKIMANLGSGKSDVIFNRLLDELKYETANNEYATFDLSLQQYRDYDVLVTPLFSCPFNDGNTDNKNVRLFIRQINGIDTDQVYAVEYNGIPSEDNIVAIAAPKYRFTEDDIKEFENYDGAYQFLDGYETVRANFTTDGASFLDKNGEKAVIASFSYPIICKTAHDTIPVTADVLYGHTDDRYFYDIRTYSDFYSNVGTPTNIGLPDREKMWDISVNFNGRSAMPDTNGSVFNRVEMFGKDGSGSDMDMGYIMPYENDDDVTDDGPGSVGASVEIGLARNPMDAATVYVNAQTLITPARAYNKRLMAVYLLPYDGSMNGYYVMTDSDKIEATATVISGVSDYPARMQEEFYKVMASQVK